MTTKRKRRRANGAATEFELDAARDAARAAQSAEFLRVVTETDARA